MADKALPPKRESSPPPAPARAKGSVKGEAAFPRPSVEGKLNLKPRVGTSQRVEPRRGTGPVKPVGLEPQPRSTGRKNVKPAGTKRVATTRDAPGERRAEQDELPDQIAAERRRARGEGSAGYVRFRMRVDDGKMSIVDSHLVDSALVMPRTLHGEYAYEVTDGARLLHADAIPDLGVVRSFSDPNGPGE